MKLKVLNLLLVLTSLVGFLEWGTDNAMFLYEAELDILQRLFTNPSSLLHPFVLLPFAGQIILLITLFQKEPGRLPTYIGMACVALLLVFMFFIGLISLKMNIFLSTLPFVTVMILTIVHLRKTNPNRK